MMISIAALLKSNGVTLADHVKHLEIRCPDAFDGALVIPKDGYSDNYRLQEAVEAKTKGGKGLIILPSLSHQSEQTAGEKWIFKSLWDARQEAPKSNFDSGDKRWGGSYETKALDYDDDFDYCKLDLEEEPHYYNVLLTVREKKDFSLVNPDMNYVECRGPCLSRVHFHAVHGLYSEAKIGDVCCAPAFEMFNRWAAIPLLDPLKISGEEPEENKPSQEPVESKTEGESIEEDECAKDTSGDDEEPKTAGAAALKKYMDNCPPWCEIQDAYRTPDSAKWADTGLYTSSSSGQRKLKQRWGQLYTEKILRMLAEGKAPVQAVLKRAWDSDQDSRKVLANYLVRRLTSGDSGVVETEDGMLIAETV